MYPFKFLPFAAICGASLLLSTDAADAAPPAAPTEFTFARSDSKILATFTWVDNSDDELGFQFEVTPPGQAPFVLDGPATDVTEYTFTGFVPGELVTFRLRAANTDENDELQGSDWSEPATVDTQDIDVYTSAFTATPGQDFSYQIPLDFIPDSTELLEALPAWLEFEESTQTFTGTAPPAGSVLVDYQCVQGVHHRAGYIYFNVINEQPLLLGTIPPVTLIDQPEAAAPVEIDLAPIFEDQDIVRAANITTAYGTIQLGFFDGYPITVGNFFAYAESDAWDGSFFHRMATLANGEDFVLQGGGYKPGATPDAYVTIPDLPPIVNEFNPAQSNICGTVSMAKLGGDPDSATNEFFISLNDNAAILDPQNGGFVVFGRATQIATVNTIANLPRSTFTVPLDDSFISFSDWPFSTLDENSPSHDQLVTMSDVSEAPTLVFSATSTGDSIAAVGAGQALGAPLLITPNGAVGSSQITLTATDLDGATVSTTFDLTVLSSYAAWADEEDAEPIENAADRPAGGVLNYVQSYAFGGDPTDPGDDLPLLPALTTVDVAGTTYDALTFRHRDLSSDLSYSVQKSADLETWESIWTTTDGYDAALVSSAAADGEFTILTVRYTDPNASLDGLYFRVAVTLQTPAP